MRQQMIPPISITHILGELTMNIEIDVEIYIDLLTERRNFIAENYNWTIADCIWDYFCDLVRECGISGNTDPSFIVDNIYVAFNIVLFNSFSFTTASIFA